MAFCSPIPLPGGKVWFGDFETPFLFGGRIVHQEEAANLLPINGERS
jgi:hypothetical protein